MLSISSNEGLKVPTRHYRSSNSLKSSGRYATSPKYTAKRKSVAGSGFRPITSRRLVLCAAQKKPGTFARGEGWPGKGKRARFNDNVYLS
jgi:hypothetical protein